MSSVMNDEFYKILKKYFEKKISFQKFKYLANKQRTK